MIPWLEEKVGRIKDLFGKLESEGFNPLMGRWETRGNGQSGGPPDEYGELIDTVAELDMRGVLIKDFARGLVDIPYIFNDSLEIYLCWMPGEKKIAWWHYISEGIQGRSPVDTLQPENKK